MKPFFFFFFLFRLVFVLVVFLPFLCLNLVSTVVHTVYRSGIAIFNPRKMDEMLKARKARQ